MNEMRPSFRETVDRAAGNTAVPLALFYCGLTSSLILIDYIFAAKFGNDFGVYWRAANQPPQDVYFWKGRFPFPYAPPMMLWIAPLALIPKWVGYFLFVGSSIAAFVLVCRRYLPTLAIAIALLSPPTVRGLLTGQVCAALAALMIWACGTTNRFAAGIAFGIIATIKPQLVVVAPLMWALDRDWRALVAAAATFLLIVFFSLCLFGPERWAEWLGSMNHFHHAVADTNIIMISTTPAAVAERFGYAPVPFLLLGIILGVVIVYLSRKAEPIEKAAAIGLGSILASPYALAYDLTVVMPFLALAVFRGRILAAIGLGIPNHPLPLIVAAYELVRTKFSPLASGNSSHAAEPATREDSGVGPSPQPRASEILRFLHAKGQASGR